MTEKTPSVLILDFDGVIIESVGIKTKAFRILFSKYTDQVDEIIDFHLMNDGLSRYRKFDHIYANILKIPLEPEESKRLGARFSEIALEEIKKCPFVNGALDLLKKYSRLVPTYIASGTPEPELREIVKVRDLDQYFTGVYGTPALKSEIAQKILKSEDLLPNQALFVGDTLTDYTEATKVGIPFIGRWDGKLPPKNPFLDHDVPVVFNMVELDSLLDKMTIGDSVRGSL